MVDYDFSSLNDKEFENISIELISRDKGKRFERFKEGKDGGVDGRFYRDDGKEEIIQCKHYLKSGFDKLMISLQKKNSNGINEIEKVKKLNPKKYLFVTSLPLSRDNKTKIKNLFSPYILNNNDIYGQEDLNDILSKNADIEEKHYKLWISSTTVLQRIMNNAIKGRSEFLIESIKDKIKYYAITENHDNALKKLKETHVVIIAGEPGIGKTTLAQQIALKYIEQGFEFYSIENLINEAEKVFERDKKQIFYFDDFLGSNYLEAIENKKDTHIMAFIERIKKDKNKRFILTSRTNIFSKSRLLSDVFKSKRIEQNEFLITIDSLKSIDKAKILYNHIWHSHLKEEYIDEIYKEKRYKIIINHRNFNPRIIEFITNDINEKNILKGNYWNFIQDKLDNPEDIWKNTFDNQSDDFIRALVALTVFNGNSIEERHLQKAYSNYIKEMNLKNNSHMSKEFQSIIEEVVRYFFNRNLKQHDVVEYALFNPSIADFVLNRYKKNDEVIYKILASLHNTRALKNLYSLKLFNKVENHLYTKVLMKLYDKIDINSIENIDYVVQLFYMMEYAKFVQTIDKTKMIQFFQMMIDFPKDFQLIDEFSSTIIYFDDEVLFNNNTLVLKLIENANSELDIINKIIDLINHFKIKSIEVIEKLNDLIHEYLSLEIDGRMNDLSIHNVNFEVEEGTVYITSGFFDSYLDAFYDDVKQEINSFEGFFLEKHSITDQINIDDLSEKLIAAYMKSYDDYAYDHKDSSNSIFIDNIDDLFER